MNDPYYETCSRCENGVEVMDNHDRYFLCNNDSTPQKCVKQVRKSVRLIAHTPDPLSVIESAAAVCYNSKPTKSGRIAKQCYKSGHTSVFEHASFTFEITGVSRALLAQITRHRIASFSVRSQRYCSEDDFATVIPNSVQKNNADNIFRSAIVACRSAYKRMVNAGVPKEDARFVLPNACETTIVMTMNMRELINFCGLRMCSRAQWEIRGVAIAMAECVREVEPQLAEYLRPNCERYAPYYFCTETHGCGKHPMLSEVFDGETP